VALAPRFDQSDPIHWAYLSPFGITPISLQLHNSVQQYLCFRILILFMLSSKPLKYLMAKTKSWLHIYMCSSNNQFKFQTKTMLVYISDDYNKLCNVNNI